MNNIAEARKHLLELLNARGHSVGGASGEYYSANHVRAAVGHALCCLDGDDPGYGELESAVDNCIMQMKANLDRIKNRNNAISDFSDSRRDILGERDNRLEVES